MKTTAKLYVHGTKNRMGEMVFTAYTNDMSKYDNFGILIDTVEVEVEFTTLSEREILDRVVAGLKACKAALEAKCYQDCQKIQDKIDSLLCLEYKAEEVEA